MDAAGREGLVQSPFAQGVTRAAAPLGLLGLWWLGSHSSATVRSVLPPPDEVVVALAREAASGLLLIHVLDSLMRAALGLAAAAVVGIALGFLMSVSPVLRRILAGPVELLRPISSVAWIPLAILWFGLGLKSVVFVIFLSCVFIILLNTLAAATHVDRDLLKAARVLGAGPGATFMKVVVPNALPGILLGVRIATAGAWGGVVVAEMIASQTGLGYMIGRAQATFQPALVIGGMVMIGTIGYAINALLLTAQRRWLGRDA